MNQTNGNHAASRRPASLILILVTVFLDLLGLTLLIPFLPSLVRSYGMGETWVGVTFAIFSIGMFIGGLVFGRLSDLHGRKPYLLITTGLNIAGYLLLAFAPSFWFFVAARFLSGLGWAGASIAQAYISDVSVWADKTKNMGLIGAVFGMSFIIWPVAGWLIPLSNHSMLGLVSALILAVNFLSIVFILPESRNKCSDPTKESALPTTFSHHVTSLRALFGVSFLMAVGFSGMQTTFALVMLDRFGVNEQGIGLLFGFIGVVSVIYQGGLVRFVRKRLNERQMMYFGLSALTFGFLFFAVNHWYAGVFFALLLFPIGNGSVMPSSSALIAKYAANESGKALGANSSAMSVGNIVGPIVAGSLYGISQGAPYFFGATCFVAAMGVLTLFLEKKSGGQRTDESASPA